MDFKNILAQLSRIISSLHKSQSCHVEERAILQCFARLDAAKDTTFL